MSNGVNLFLYPDIWDYIFPFLHHERPLWANGHKLRICKTLNYETLLCHVCKAVSAGGTWERAELDSGVAAGRHLTTCHKVFFISSPELLAKFNHILMLFPWEEYVHHSIAGRSHRPCTSCTSMAGSSRMSEFLTQEELVQDMRWAEEQLHAGLGALGQAT